jgi:beta-lactamase superfamily II metal-dependent hydrolase
VGGAALLATALLLLRPDGRVHVYALDVGTGSAVLIRDAGGHQLLIDGGPNPDRFAQAIGRALPPTARTIDIWLITGGQRAQIGAGLTVLQRFRVDRILIADPDPWTPTLRSLVQQAQAAGVPAMQLAGAIRLDGVTLAVDGDQRTWLVRAARGAIAVVPPQTSWQSVPPAIDGAIFTGGGPQEWEGPGHGFSVIEVAAASRDGLPARSMLQALTGAPIYRTDRLGSVELIADASPFQPAQ